MPRPQVFASQWWRSVVLSFCRFNHFTVFLSGVPFQRSLVFPFRSVRSFCRSSQLRRLIFIVLSFFPAPPFCRFTAFSFHRFAVVPVCPALLRRSDVLCHFVSFCPAPPFCRSVDSDLALFRFTGLPSFRLNLPCSAVLALCCCAFLRRSAVLSLTFCTVV